MPAKKAAAAAGVEIENVEGVEAKVPEAPQALAGGPPPLPKPPKKPYSLELPSTLVDLPCVYLYDRSGWSDFKRALNECGLVWNLSDWMTTIVYHGKEWDAICAKSEVKLDEYFPMVEKKAAGDGADSKSSALGAKLVGLLGLPARQKMWNWIVRSLRGARSTPGPYHYLVDEVQIYDISHLRKAIKRLHDQ